MVRIQPKNWWQAGLMFGTAMLAWYLIRDWMHGELTLVRVGKELLTWAVAGLLFGVLLAAVLSVLSRSNQFRSDREGER